MLASVRNIDTLYPHYKTAGNDRTAFLKAFALLCMIADHCGVIFFKGIIEFRAIGRLAFPIYAWCIVVGMGYTSNPLRYSLRLLAALIISQFFYMKALNHNLIELNVMATLLMGQLAILGIQYKRYASQYWAPVLVLVISLIVRMDYGFKGVLLIILLYLCRDSRRALIAFMIAFCLFWGEGTGNISKLFGIDFSVLRKVFNYSSSLFDVVFRLQNLAVFSLILILYPIGWRKRFPAWIGYIAYPGHLLILWLLKLAISK